jgi:glutamate 5-kinase
LTDVPGLIDRDPGQHGDAALISTMPAAGPATFEASDLGSKSGRGGMRSKVEAAQIAAQAGCHAIIASGLEPEVLARVLRGEDCGTWFPAQLGLNARRRWIAWGSPAKGTLFVDAGAVRALRERGASLLAAGVQRIEGRFVRGEVVELRSLDGEARIGRGMVSCDAEAATLWIAGQAPLSARNHHALVHRDHLVLERAP